MKKSIVKIFAPLMMALIMIFSVVFIAGCNNDNANKKKPLNLTTASAVYDLKGPMIDGVEATAEEKETYQLQEPMYCFVSLDLNAGKVTFNYMFLFNEDKIQTTLDISVTAGEDGTYVLTTNKGSATLNPETKTIVVLELASSSEDALGGVKVEWTFEYFEALDFDLTRTIEDRIDAYYDSLS